MNNTCKCKILECNT